MACHNEIRPHAAPNLSTPKAFAAARPFERARQAASTAEICACALPKLLVALSIYTLYKRSEFYFLKILASDCVRPSQPSGKTQ